MGSLTKTSLVHRGLLKMLAVGAVSLILALAAMSIGNTEKAYAATGDTVAVEDMNEGTEYSVTDNLYVKAEFNIILKRNAYLTNLTTPNLFKGQFPTTPLSDNATIVKNADGTFTVNITPLNNTFGLISIADTASNGAASVTNRVYYENWNTGGYSQRINGLTFAVSDTSGSYSFTASEYANYMNVGDKSWPVTLQIDFSSVKEK